MDHRLVAVELGSGGGKNSTSVCSKGKPEGCNGKILFQQYQCGVTGF